MKFSSYFTPYNSSYPTCERTVVRFRLYCGEMDPDEVTVMLGISPSTTEKKGSEYRSERSGRVRVSKLNAWFLWSEGSVSSKDLRDHLDWLLSALHPKLDVLRELQERREINMQVSCVWWSQHGDGGPVLWPVHMLKMSDLNLECGFEFAYYGDE